MDRKIFLTICWQNFSDRILFRLSFSNPDLSESTRKYTTSYTDSKPDHSTKHHNSDSGSVPDLISSAKELECALDARTESPDTLSGSQLERLDSITSFGSQVEISFDDRIKKFKRIEKSASFSQSRKILTGVNMQTTKSICRKVDFLDKKPELPEKDYPVTPPVAPTEKEASPQPEPQANKTPPDLEPKTKTTLFKPKPFNYEKVFPTRFNSIKSPSFKFYTIDVRSNSSKVSSNIEYFESNSYSHQSNSGANNSVSKGSHLSSPPLKYHTLDPSKNSKTSINTFEFSCEFYENLHSKHQLMPPRRVKTLGDRPAISLSNSHETNSVYRRKFTEKMTGPINKAHKLSTKKLNRNKIDLVKNSEMDKSPVLITKYRYETNTSSGSTSLGTGSTSQTHILSPETSCSTDSSVSVKKSPFLSGKSPKLHKLKSSVSNVQSKASMFQNRLNKNLSLQRYRFWWKI